MEAPIAAVTQASGQSHSGLRTRRLGLAALLLVAGVAGLRLFPWDGFGWQPNTRMPPPRSRSRSVAAVGGAYDFYSARLGSWEAAQARRAHARTSLQESELRWVSTAQDAFDALMVSEETGFATWGVETQVAEIPVGWHTGRHRHGEEAIYIVTGEGFVAVDGVRYDFHAGTTLGIPHGSLLAYVLSSPRTGSSLPPQRYPVATWPSRTNDRTGVPPCVR